MLQGHACRNESYLVSDATRMSSGLLRQIRNRAKVKTGTESAVYTGGFFQKILDVNFCFVAD